MLKEILCMRGGSSKTRIETYDPIKEKARFCGMRGGSSKTRIETLVTLSRRPIAISMRGGSSKTRIETLVNALKWLIETKYERRFQ